jgi:two-component system, response regulator YesN
MQQADSGLIRTQHRWSDQSHVVVGIELNQSMSKGSQNETDWHLFRFTVENIMREVVRERFEHYDYIELHTHHSAVLLHVPPDEKAADVLPRIRQLGKKIIQCLYDYVQLNVHVGIGGLKTNWRQIPYSTKEAFHALSTKCISSCSTMNVFELNSELGTEQQPASDQGETIRPVKLYQQFSEAVKYAQEDRAIELVDTLLEQLADRSVTPSELHKWGIELWTVMTYSLYDIGMQTDTIFPNFNVLKEMEGIFHPKQLASWLTDKINIMCNHQQWEENVKHRQMVTFMTEYVHQHYAENITLNDLAREVYFSRNFLGQIFR